MSSVNTVGISASQLSSALSAVTGGGQATPDAATSTLSLSQLQRLLRQQIDQAFKQGSSISDTGTSLANTVSTTLQQYGVSDDQREQVVTGLQQIFDQAASRAEARQNAQQFLDNFVQSLSGSPSAGQPATSLLPDTGQNFDAAA